MIQRAERLILLASFAALLSGCAHEHLAHNAPGHVEVMRPPEKPLSHKVVEPRDPGEQMLVLAIGPMASLGWSRPLAASSGSLAGNFSIEGSVHYGRDDRSHYEDNWPIYPPGSIGLNLGASAIATGEGTRGLLYSEAQYATALMGAAGGWAMDPGNSKHGPQGTIFLGPFYSRATFLMHDRAEVSFGFFFKLSDVLVWSQ